MAKNLIEKITEKQINPNIPEFRVGDTVCVDCKIIEEKGGKSKERIQKFEGIVISRKGKGATESRGEEERGRGEGKTAGRGEEKTGRGTGQGHSKGRCTAERENNNYHKGRR